MTHRPRHLAPARSRTDAREPAPSSAPLWLQALTFVALVALMAGMIWAGPRIMDPGPTQHPDVGRPAIVDNHRR